MYISQCQNTDYWADDTLGIDPLILIKRRYILVCTTRFGITFIRCAQNQNSQNSHVFGEKKTNFQVH